jgi:hypothetical protein
VTAAITLAGSRRQLAIREDSMKNIKSASETPRRFRRLLASALLTLSVVAGTIATTATPVEAATAVVACFTPSVYTYHSSSLPVLLQAWNGGTSYSTIGYGVLNQGCVAWNIGPLYQNRYLRVKINDNISYYGAWYWGQTTQHAGPGYGPVVLLDWSFCQPCDR